MKTPSLRLLLLLGILIVCQLLNAASALAAQVSSIPISNKYFEGEIRFHDGSKAQFESREGALIRVEQNAESPTYTGLILYLAKDGKKVKVLILKIQTQSSGESVLSAEKPEEINLGSVFGIQQSDPIRLTLNRVGERSFPNPPSNLQDPSVYSSELCCVEFGTKRICSNFVNTPAGACSASNQGSAR